MSSRMPGNARATEDGLHITEEWVDLQHGTGEPLSIVGELEYDMDSGEVRRKHESIQVSVRYPEQPY